MLNEARPEFQLYTDKDLEDAFREGIPIYFDTNVLRLLWRMHPKPQQEIVGILATLSGRTWLPYQTRYELAAQANGPTVLNGIPEADLAKARGLIESAFMQVAARFREANPVGVEGGDFDKSISDLSAAITEQHEAVNSWLSDREKDLIDLLGESPDVDAIREGRVKNPLPEILPQLFLSDHLLPEPSEETQEERTARYQSRTSGDNPIGPGLTDRTKKLPRDAAGDYLLWQEALDHCKTNGFNQGFILLTEERKQDFWEEQQGPGKIRRVAPAIQRECIEQTGGPMHLMPLSSLLELTIPHSSELQGLRALVDSASPQEKTWSAESVSLLLEGLREEGYVRQALVIKGAAKRGGTMSRAEIAKALDWGDENRYLTRFRMPADRLTANLVDEGVLGEGAPPPLRAVYDGPGEAIGYKVPPEFVEILFSSDREAS